MQVPIILTEDLNEADILMTLKSYYRKHPQPIVEAERLGKPVYVLRSNTVIQMESCLADIFSWRSVRPICFQWRCEKPRRRSVKSCRALRSELAFKALLCVASMSWLARPT
ncbi:MAG: hypothetical protein U0401_14140 [Anaerolineae bacterium]